LPPVAVTSPIAGGRCAVTGAGGIGTPPAGIAGGRIPLAVLAPMTICGRGGTTTGAGAEALPAAAALTTGAGTGGTPWLLASDCFFQSFQPPLSSQELPCHFFAEFHLSSCHTTPAVRVPLVISRPFVPLISILPAITVFLPIVILPFCLSFRPGCVCLISLHGRPWPLLPDSWVLGR